MIRTNWQVSALFYETNGRTWHAGEVAVSQVGRVLLLDDVGPNCTGRCAVLPATVYGFDLSHLNCVPRIAYEAVRI